MLHRCRKAVEQSEMIMARALKMADNRLHLLIESKGKKDEKIKEMEPKALFADSSTSETTILIGELAKILGNGIDIGQNRLFRDTGRRIFDQTERNGLQHANTGGYGKRTVPYQRNCYHTL